MTLDERLLQEAVQAGWIPPAQAEWARAQAAQSGASALALIRDGLTPAQVAHLSERWHALQRSESGRAPEGGSAIDADATVVARSGQAPGSSEDALRTKALGSAAPSTDALRTAPLVATAPLGGGGIACGYPHSAPPVGGEGAAGKVGPVVGDAVDGFTLVAELGRGGMGVVFRAREDALGREVALKVLLAGEEAPSEELERFRIEAQALAQLSHPGFVRVLGAGAVGQRPYLAMDLIEGQALDERLKRAGPLDVREAVQGALELARAMSYAHARGILHRDLKPANVLAHVDGRWLITDFGLAKDTREGSALTKTGQLLGTPAYMPPEQASGEVSLVDERADVYSLGATLFALLTGRAPFGGGNAVNVITQVLRTPPPAPSSLRSEVDGALDALVLECLSKERLLRYRSMDALAEDLERWLAGEGTQAAQRRFKRRLTFALSAVVALFLLAAGTAGAVVLRRPPPRVVEPIVVALPELALSSSVFATAAAEVRAEAQVVGDAHDLRWSRNGDSLPYPGPVPLVVGRNEIRLEALSAGEERVRSAPLVVWRFEIPDGFRAGDAPTEIVCERDQSVLLYHPPGRFFMGWDDRDQKAIERYFTEIGQVGAIEGKLKSRRKNENPGRRVELSRGFFLGKYEVTWRQYEGFCHVTGRVAPERASVAPSTSFVLTDDMPVAGITWGQAKSYCEGLGMRLPTEAEWEYAARGGEEARLFPSGEELPDQGVRHGNLAGDRDGFGYLAPVGSFPLGVSRWGCHDMIGNVYEFTSDLKYAYRKEEHRVVDPVSPNKDVFSLEAAAGATQDEIDQAEKRRSRVQKKGGCFDNGWHRGRSAFRNTSAINDRSPGVGFRVCLDASPRR